MIVKLFEYTFGKKFCVKLPITVLTAKMGNSSSATPELARTKGSRIVFIDEPEDDVSLNKGIIKRFIGGDSFYTRALHSNGGDVDVSFKMVLTSNRVPTVPNADKAIKERLRIFPYLSTWVDNPPDSEEERFKTFKFKKDRFFEKKIKVLTNAFLWIMVQYYSVYIKEGLKDPAIVTEKTNEYWRDNDIYTEFYTEKIKPVYDDNNELNHKVKITLPELYAEFRTWFKESAPNDKPPSKFVFRDYMSLKLGNINDPSKPYWTGYTIFGTDANFSTNQTLMECKKDFQNSTNKPSTPNNILKIPPPTTPIRAAKPSTSKPSTPIKILNYSPKSQYNLTDETIAI
jgi:phage/plasmid-associated DNA primase